VDLYLVECLPRESSRNNPRMRNTAPVRPDASPSAKTTVKNVRGSPGAILPAIDAAIRARMTAVVPEYCPPCQATC
jgi:hypothetical protein